MSGGWFRASGGIALPDKKQTGPWTKGCERSKKKDPGGEKGHFTAGSRDRMARERQERDIIKGDKKSQKIRGRRGDCIISRAGPESETRGGGSQKTRGGQPIFKGERFSLFSAYKGGEGRNRKKEAKKQERGESLSILLWGPGGRRHRRRSRKCRTARGKRELRGLGPWVGFRYAHVSSAGPVRTVHRGLERG